MSNTRKIPDRLYKYRSFSNRLLDELIGDRLFFANPSSFNDPLDTKPSLATDLDASALAEILGRLVEERISAEMSAAAKTIKYRGPKTLNHISVHSRRRAEQMIEEVRYNATNPEYEIEDPARFLFGQYVEDELLLRYDKGVVCLAGRSECPLMWSHYGDQHKGVCIGYSVPASAAENLHKITYGGSRAIEASTVAEMLDGDEAARRKVDEAVLTRKAVEWRYEREWRLVGPRGAHDSPLELEEVVFGMRCELPGRFLLGKHVLDTGELKASLPRRALDVRESFEPLLDEASPNGKAATPAG